MPPLFEKSHQKLEVWKQAMDLTVNIYTETKAFPKEEQYGLTSQMRRASVSIPSNISEGAARNSNKEFIQFLYIALGSCSELDTQVILCYKLGYITTVSHDKLLTQIHNIHKLLIGLIRYRKSK